MYKIEHDDFNGVIKGRMHQSMQRLGLSLLFEKDDDYNEVFSVFIYV